MTEHPMVVQQTLHFLCMVLKHQMKMVATHRFPVDLCIETIPHSLLNLIDNGTFFQVQDGKTPRDVTFMLAFHTHHGQLQVLQEQLHEHLEQAGKPQGGPINPALVLQHIAWQVQQDTRHWQEQVASRHITPEEALKGITESTLGWISNQKPLALPGVVLKWMYLLGKNTTPKAMPDTLLDDFKTTWATFKLEG